MTTGAEMLKWFGLLNERDKVDVLRGLLAQLETLDPKAEGRMQMWKIGKTVRLTTDLATPDGVVFRGVPIHMSVEDGDRALWRSFQSRVQSGKLDFTSGWTVASRGTAAVVGEHAPSWVASLGVGTLVAQEYRGELLFMANKRKPMPIPQGMQPGSPIPAALPEREGFSILLFEGQLIILGSFPGLRPPEIRAARSSPVRLGVTKFSDGLMILGLNVKGLTDGWADLPFALAIERPENRHITSAEMTGERSILLVLAERTTQKVAVMRPLRLSTQWSAEFERILEFQQDSLGTYDRKAYLRDIKASHERWPTPNHVAKDFTAVELAKTDPIGEFDRTGQRS